MPTPPRALRLRPVVFLGRPLVLTFSLVLLVACENAPQVSDEEDGLANLGGTGGGTRPGGDGIDLGRGGAPGGDDPDTNPEPGICGNGVLEPGEICDDGNTAGGDGCGGDCVEQDPEFDCSEPGEPCRDTVVCGNSVLEGSEECDDDNEEPLDGCDADCRLEEGYACARPGTPCLLLPVCGNSIRERGEQCDDGNDTDPGDGCDACEQQEGFFCVPGLPCVALVCGDGNRTPDEECDDGPGSPGAPGTPSSGDGCSEACEVEEGYRCSGTSCTETCGDGFIVGVEECDDSNRVSGDGCSSACKVEPFTSCVGEPSVCDDDIECGNGEVEPGEICDPPGTDGCLPGCASFSPSVGTGSVCGNHIIEVGEGCDAPNPGNGCALGCVLEDDFVCPRPDTCFPIPQCGDGIVHFALGETCDDGNEPSSGDGCSACGVEDGWTCTGLEPSVCVQEICGDGIRTPSEECDEGMGDTTAGCVACQVTTGWACPTAGEPCIERCGDGEVVGSEECDLGDTDSGDGCNAACRVEPGFLCDESSCTEGVCGNGVVESGEGCDDDNLVAGDGCGPTCQVEPTITRDPSPAGPLYPYPDPVVNVSCGDGLVTGTEECDDGNTDDDDGCSSTCEVEAGFVCATEDTYPDQVELRVVYRDFKADDQSGGHPDFQRGISSLASVPGPVCTATNNAPCLTAAGVVCPALSCGRLDLDGKPVYHQTSGGQIENASSFALWYRDTNTFGVVDKTASPAPTEVMTFTESLILDRQGDETSDVYRAADGTFYPLTGRGFGNYSAGQNYHFTTEIRYFFQYKGGETLTFRGDDDVWVFVNGRHAVDIGGVHGAQYGRVVLGDDRGYDGSGVDSNCSVHRGSSLPGCTLEAAETAEQDTDDTRFGLEIGGVYEIVLFNAERHTSESNFELTLAGFLAPRSFCAPECGDGQVVGYEVCDDGEDNQADPATGECNDTCTARAYCGDGQQQSGEECDNGSNLDLYDVGSVDQCAPGCISPPSCGDGELQAAFESCDNGMQNSDSAYGPTSCNASCGLGLYCGDGIHTVSEEVCDEGADNGVSYGSESCSYDCEEGPRCGDGVRNGAEECDAGADNGTEASFCSSECTIDEYCGDGAKTGDELCDYGQFASNAYGGCTDECVPGPSCGDGIEQLGDGEECDEGELANTGGYGECTEICTLGPRCGDGEWQESEGEQCDNGFNEDTYAFVEDSCGPGCTSVPFCGDGNLQSAFELCDFGADNADGVYEGCTTTCEWGPFCGDGHLDTSEEECDDGTDNTAYSALGEACGYDCKPAAYCGDGERNGPEQCDDGDDNGSEYGGCKDDCTRAPFCGDGITQRSRGEQCDSGPTGSLECSTTCKTRSVIR